MNGRAFVALMLGALAAMAIATSAQVPALFNYQVMLTDDADQPLADQTVTMVFSLYDAESGGTQLWTETQTPTTNSIGVVSLVLGNVTPITFDFNAPYWLDVEVNGQTLSPRRPLTASPYAGRAAIAGDSDRLGGIDASEYALLSEVGGDGHSLDADDGSPTDALYVDAGGNVGIGTTSPQMELHVSEEVQVGSPATAGSLTVHGGSAANGKIVLRGDDPSGAAIRIDNGDGNLVGRLAQSYSSGGGGQLVIGRNSAGTAGFIVEGNYGSSQEPRMVVNGSGRWAIFDMGESGDDCVALPDDAISSSEVLDEPGVASIQAADYMDLTNGSTYSVAARTIFVPSSGYVYAVGTGTLRFDNVPGSSHRAVLGVSTSQYSFSGATQESEFMMPGGMPLGYHTQSFSVSGLFQVNEGSHTFYLVANADYGNCDVAHRQLTLMYFPTAHGTVDTID